MSEQVKAMNNVKVGVSKGKLVLTMDLNEYMEKATLSESGKMYMVASSSGFQNVTAKGFEDIKFSLNVGVTKKRFEELQKIAELEAKGGRVVSGLPSQREEQLEKENREQKSQMENMQKQMLEMQQMMAQLVAAQTAQAPVDNEPQQQTLDVKEVADTKKKTTKSK